MRYSVILSLAGILLFIVSSLGFAQTDSGGAMTGGTPDGAITEEGEKITEPSCFQENFSGEYKTIRPGASKFPAERYIFIHEGPCKCEGKSAPDCAEPVDDK